MKFPYLTLMLAAVMAFVGCSIEETSTGPEPLNYATGLLAGNWDCSFEWFPAGSDTLETVEFGVRIEFLRTNQYEMDQIAGEREPLTFIPPRTLQPTGQLSANSIRIENDNFLRWLNTGALQNFVCRRS